MKFSITKNGEPLNTSLYTWNETTQTLSTKESNLVLDFSNYNNCTFNAGYNCTFKTGDGCTFHSDDDCAFDTGDYCTFNTSYGCTFKTGTGCIFNTDYGCTFHTDNSCTFSTGNNCTFNTSDGCTFNTGNNCTFDTGDSCIFNTGYNCAFNTDYSCTFDTGDGCIFNTSYGCIFNTENRCVVARRDIFEFYDISNVKNLTTAPYRVKGYIKDDYYYQGGKKQYKAIIADGILSEIVEHKGNVYKVKNYGSDNISYLVKDGDVYSHGKTLKEAKESLIYKLSNRDTSAYKDYKLDTKVSKKEAIQMYRAITGACEQGTRMFVERLEKVPKNLTIKKIIELTEMQYGNNSFRQFFEEASE